MKLKLIYRWMINIKIEPYVLNHRKEKPQAIMKFDLNGKIPIEEKLIK
jgi:hypothetical protein